MELSWMEGLSSIVLMAVSAMAGALVMMRRMDEICSSESRYGLSRGNADLIGATVGGFAGLGITILIIYYYFFSPPGSGWVQWIGRSSYVLILSASAGHLVVLLHLWIRLNSEDKALRNPGPTNLEGTLSRRRQTALDRSIRSGALYADLKVRDDETVGELMEVFGEKLLSGQRVLNRIPFYGYLGTVCGILMMAQELTKLDEATETFQVLRDMAGGLVLAFKTTLVALLAYLPLRKGFDILLLKRMAALERAWLTMRDDALERENR